jgi:hypothetical protein
MMMLQVVHGTLAGHWQDSIPASKPHQESCTRAADKTIRVRAGHYASESENNNVTQLLVAHLRLEQHGNGDAWQRPSQHGTNDDVKAHLREVAATVAAVVELGRDLHTLRIWVPMVTAKHIVSATSIRVELVHARRMMQVRTPRC